METTEDWLYFIHAQSSMFHQAIFKIEGNSISLMEVLAVISELRTKLEERLREVYSPLIVRTNLTKLEEQGHQCISDFKNIATKFYSELFKYLNHWTES